MRDRAKVRRNHDGSWTATLPSFGFRSTAETKTLPPQKAACAWAHRTLTRYPAGISGVDNERSGWHDGIATWPAWSPLIPVERF